MLGQADLGRDPVRPADPAGRRRPWSGWSLLASSPGSSSKGHLPYLWREWITSVDHKRIGVMYMLLALVMLLRGFTDAHHDARAAGDRLSTSAGLSCRRSTTTRFSRRTARIMIFFVAMPFVIGLMNFVVPLQLGVRDVAFPTLNSVGFWLTATGALLVNISLVVGEFARTGWLRLSAAVGARRTRPASASTTTSGRCRSRASARCWRASISSPRS